MTPISLSYFKQSKHNNMKHLRIAFWTSLNRRIADKTTKVRAVIDSLKENYSIDVSFYESNDHISEAPHKQLPESKITIELPRGIIWKGSIEDLQNDLRSSDNILPF